VELSLLEILDVDCTWDSQLFGERGSRKIIHRIRGLTSFLENCRLLWHPDQSSDELFFSFGLTWPTPWRPRVHFSGVTHLTCSEEGKIVHIQDRWDVPPREIFGALLPRWEDIYSFYNSPPVETIELCRMVEKRGRDYTIVVEAAREEVQIPVEEREAKSPHIFCAPVGPPDVFIGDIRRLEIWSAVRPIFLTVTPTGLDWSVPVPYRYQGRANVTPPTSLQFRDENGNVRPDYIPVPSKVVCVPRRRYALRRFRGFPLSEEVHRKAEEFVSDLVSQEPFNLNFTLLSFRDMCMK